MRRVAGSSPSPSWSSGAPEELEQLITRCRCCGRAGRELVSPQIKPTARSEREGCLP